MYYQTKEQAQTVMEANGYVAKDPMFDAYYNPKKLHTQELAFASVVLAADNTYFIHVRANPWL